ncbi:dynein intermediate chain 2, ciliary [Halyomorpha halys]|uniref:dynein intermediate chain 2, ciliary n=1 Tax=Halyomorpha halys TaxID=286706 RepID=UPI0006D4D73C|nr:dynein intermediate chain 2, ciliary-like [Halyomorpha halys]
MPGKNEGGEEPTGPTETQPSETEIKHKEPEKLQLRTPERKEIFGFGETEEDEEAIALAKKIKEKEEKFRERRYKIAQVKENTLSVEDAIREGKEELVIKPALADLIPEELTNQQLNEGITRSLLSDNPYLDTNRVIFNHEKREFQKVIKNSREVVLYEIEGCIIHSSSHEAEVQAIRLKREEKWAQKLAAINERQKRLLRAKVDERKRMSRKDTELDEIGLETEEAGEETSSDVGEEGEGEEGGISPRIDAREDDVPGKKLVNRFNYSDRSVLTLASISREKGTQTAPNPRAQITGQVSQWIIYDHYQKDYAAIQEAKEKERQAKMIIAVKKEDRTIKKPVKTEDPIYKRMAEGIKILERMLNQNTYDHLAQDCQFYEDPGDKYRIEEGVLLPLWEFKYAPAKGIAVTQVKWNPAYKDLFGVTFGILDFVENDDLGVLSVFTLKNPSFPEFVKHFDSGALCLDFHPRKCYYVCVGLQDGSVVVHNMQTPNCETQYRSTVEHNHRSQVWSVLWCDDHRDRHLSFFSAGADGRICKWLLLQNELLHSPVITLYIDKHEINADGPQLKLKAMPTCLTFHPKDFEIFMVGTAFGTIYKCSISYASTYFYHMKVHDLTVYRISYNRFIPDIFATAGGDWRMKIWEDGRPEPLFIYNLDASVQDVEWAPYSSTVIAGITAVGRVYIYDLNVNKYIAACAQYVVCADDDIATCLTFNPAGHKMPLVLVGDSRGTITTLKLSPNLRLKPKQPRKRKEAAVHIDETALEISKLEKILYHVQEPMLQKETEE